MTKVNRNCKTKFRLFDTSLWYQLLGSNFIRFHWTFLMIINCFVCFNPKKKFFFIISARWLSDFAFLFCRNGKFWLEFTGFWKVFFFTRHFNGWKFFNQVFTDIPDSRSMIDLIKSFFFKMQSTGFSTYENCISACNVK